MLEATLDADATPDAVSLTFTATNPGSEPVELSFRDAQRVEFVAERADDETEVWRWSDDRMFGMATGSETLDAGETASYTETWADPPSGEYVVRGWLTATDATAEAETRVGVP